MMVRYEILDRLYEWTKYPHDLDRLKAIRADLAAYDQPTRDELVRFADDRAVKWKEAGEEAIAGLWERFAAEVRRADPG